MQITLTNSIPVIIEMFNDADINVVVAPNANSTITIEYSLSPLSDIRAGTAHYYAWASGAITGVAVQAVFDAPISAMRATATTGTGIVEYLELGRA